MKKIGSVLSLPEALSWIIGSLIVTFIVFEVSYKQYLRTQYRAAKDPKYTITHLVQTGPQRESLKTDYLAELLGLASDRRVSSVNFHATVAEERLLKSPLIEKAHVKVVGPHTLYIDYVVRQPIAWAVDYQNVALDKQGYPIPFTPFFAPKNLPEIYLGLEKSISWNTPIEGKEITLAFEILKLIQDPKIRECFPIKKIDVSYAFSKPTATREVILTLEDEVIHKNGLVEAHILIPRILRLSPKRYAQELGNYLKLREKLLTEVAERYKNFTVPLGQPLSMIKEKPQVIDFRLENLAFIDEGK